MAILQTKWIADDAVTDAKVKLRNNQYLRGRNPLDDNDVNILKVNGDGDIEFAFLPKIGSDQVLTSADKGAANGVASLDATGKVPASQLPGFVDDVVEYANLASFPSPGESGKLYVALDTGFVYRWSGSAYVEIASSEIPGADEISYEQLNPNDWSVVDGSSIKATLDEVGSRIQTLEDAPDAPTPINQVITITSTDLSNGFITLSQAPIGNVATVSPKGGLIQEPEVDYSISGQQLNLLGDLASILSAGDKLFVSYVY